MSKVQRAIEARKKSNAAYDYMDSVIADEKRKQQIANFEIATTKKIEKRMKNVNFEIFSDFYCHRIDYHLWNEKLKSIYTIDDVNLLIYTTQRWTNGKRKFWRMLKLRKIGKLGTKEPYTFLIFV